MEEADKDWVMIRMVGGWVFLLVPAHPGSPGQRAIKRSWCCCSYSNVIVTIFLKLPASSMSVAICIYLLFEYMICYQTAFTSACAWLSKKILQLSADCQNLCGLGSANRRIRNAYVCVPGNSPSHTVNKLSIDPSVARAQGPGQPLLVDDSYEYSTAPKKYLNEV